MKQLHIALLLMTLSHPIKLFGNDEFSDRPNTQHSPEVEGTTLLNELRSYYDGITLNNPDTPPAIVLSTLAKLDNHIAVITNTERSLEGYHRLFIESPVDASCPLEDFYVYLLDMKEQIACTHAEYQQKLEESRAFTQESITIPRLLQKSVKQKAGRVTALKRLQK